MSFRRRIKACFDRSRLIARLRKKEGVALFIVLSSMATLAIFVGEITYTAQVNQKLAYDRLDQIKAHSLAKSGLRLALLRIRAYAEIKKTIGDLTKQAGGNAAAAAAVNQAVPKAVLEKVWGEPITIPFSGDVSGLPLAARGAIEKFRKDSSMEGKLYIAIQAQSAKINLNSTIAAFAPSPTASPAASPTATPVGGVVAGGSGTSASPTPQGFDQEEARKLLTQQIRDTFAQKFEEDEKFRDRYRSLRPEDLTDEILGWSDLTYQSQSASRSNIPYKQAPFYDVSELHYLPSIDDDVYEVLAQQFTTGVANAINLNTIKEPVLAALVPQMTADERQKFFEYRDNLEPSEASKQQQPAGQPAYNPDEDHTFKSEDDFYKYLKEKVAWFAGSQTKIDDFKTALAQRGISLVTEESNFIVRIEATVNQTKRTLEAWVSLIQDKSSVVNRPGGAGGTGANPSPSPSPGAAATTPVTDPTQERSNLKITQLRFL